MKKSVIFTIAIIYLMSIFIVTLFGMQISVDQFEIYISSLQITNYDEIVGGKKYKTIYMDEDTHMAEFQVEYDFAPKNASYPEKIKFILKDEVKYKDGEPITIANMTKFGQVAFRYTGVVTVQVYTTDGSSKLDTIVIMCLNAPTT